MSKSTTVPFYRQGDVGLRLVEQLPANAKPMKPEKGGLVILAYGEVTGHHHSLRYNNGRVTMYGQDNDGPKHVKIERPAVLSHQEHSPIEIPPGVYEVVNQVEHTPAAIRRVAD